MSARNAPTRAHAPDKAFLIISGILVVVGITILTSASVALAQRDHGNGFYYVARQLLYGGSLGIILGIIVQILPISWFKKISLVVFAGTVGLLLIVFIPGIGIGTKGAVRWISLGLITIQPGEIARIALPWYLAAWFAAKVSLKEKMSNELLVPFLMILAIIGLPLLLQPDLSTLGVITLTALAMYLLAGGSWRSIAFLIGTGLTTLLLLIRIAPYRVNRITAFLDPQADPLGVGYQVNQALLAVGSGGLLGRGLGLSREKLFFLPEPMGDAIFAILAEEVGFIGTFILVGLFVVFLWRGFSIVRRLNEPFMRLFSAGLIIWIVLQAFLNIAGNIAIAPLVGITLPFVSYGNASFAMTILSVAIVYRFSRYTSEITKNT